MKFTLSILFLLAIILPSHSQKTILGSVVNIDKEPISQVKIQLGESAHFVYSDIDGAFIINDSKKNDVLFFSHLAYESKKVELSQFSNLSNNDTIKIEISLTRKDKLLDSVVIRSKNIQSVCVEKDISIMNYSFIDDNILILFKERMRFKIRLVTKGGKVILEHPLHFKPKELIKDCMGNVHLIGKDSCYEITDIRTPLYNIHPTADFDNYLAPCVASSPNHFYFASYSDYNQSICYISTNKTNKEKTLLKKIEDKVAIDVARAYENDIRSDPHPHTIEASTATMEGARKKLQKAFWFQTNLTKETYHPLIQLNDSLYLFDHINNTCYVYNEEGISQREFLFDYTSLRDWQPQLIPDAFHNAIYTITKTEGMVNLHQINLLSGEIHHTYPLNEHSFPIHIQVRGDFVYYIHTTSGGFNKLYRQRLKE